MPATRVESTPSLTIVDSGLHTDILNLVCGTRLRSSELPEVAGRVLEHLRSSARPFSWWVYPGDEPDDLAKRLGEAGLEERETELAMSLDLVSRAPEPGMPDGVEIREAASRDDVAASAAGASLYRSFGFREFGLIKELKPPHS